MKIAIIGAGRMGSWLVHELSRDHELGLYDLDPEKARALDSGTVFDGPAGVASFQPDMLINAASLPRTVEAFQEVLPHLPPDCLLVDIASVKGKIPDFYKDCGFRFALFNFSRCSGVRGRPFWATEIFARVSGEVGCPRRDSRRLSIVSLDGFPGVLPPSVRLYPWGARDPFVFTQWCSFASRSSLSKPRSMIFTKNWSRPYFRIAAEIPKLAWVLQCSTHLLSARLTV